MMLSAAFPSLGDAALQLAIVSVRMIPYSDEELKMLYTFKGYTGTFELWWAEQGAKVLAARTQGAVY